MHTEFKKDLISNPYYLTRLIIVVLLLASLFPLFLAYYQKACLSDDAYITLTYAKNLAAGNGFIFNHPPATLGTTTPLFTLAVAGLAYLFPTIELSNIAVFFTVACWIGIVWIFFLFRATWDLKDWQAGILGLVIIASAWIGYLGMEAYLFALLLVVTLSCFFNNRYLLTGAFLGLLFLTRGEGILLLFLLLIWIIARDWMNRRKVDIQCVKPALYLVIGFFAVVLPWLVYAHNTFGSVLPNSLDAKQAQKQAWSCHSFLYGLIHGSVPLWKKQFAVYHNSWWLFVLLGIVSALLLKRKLTILLAWVIFYVIGYTVLGVPGYPWYQLPILFVLQLFLGLGVIKCVDVLISRIKSVRLSLGLSFLFVSLMFVNLAKPTVKSAIRYQNDPKWESYMELGRWFSENTSSSESVAFIEVGYLGYYTNNRIIDLCGLTLPDIIPHIARNDISWGFWNYMPDYYVYVPDFDWALASIRANPKFDQLYNAAAVLPGPVKRELVIYKLKR